MGNVQFATYPLVNFYFIKTKSIFQGVFDYFNQISDELHYGRLCILLQNSSTFDFSGHTCGQNDSLRLFLRYKKQGSKSITLLLPRYSYIISTRLFFVVVMTAVVAVAAVKIKVKLCAAIRTLGRAILNGSAVEIYSLAA